MIDDNTRITNGLKTIDFIRAEDNPLAKNILERCYGMMIIHQNDLIFEGNFDGYFFIQIIKDIVQRGNRISDYLMGKSKIPEDLPFEEVTKELLEKRDIVNQQRAFEFVENYNCGLIKELMKQCLGLVLVKANEEISISEKQFDLHYYISRISSAAK